jgi:hypothetical protein
VTDSLISGDAGCLAYPCARDRELDLQGPDPGRDLRPAWLIVIWPFDVLRVNGHVINADGEVTAERANEWGIWAHVKVREDLQDLARLSLKARNPWTLRLGPPRPPRMSPPEWAVVRGSTWVARVFPPRCRRSSGSSGWGHSSTRSEPPPAADPATHTRPVNRARRRRLLKKLRENLRATAAEDIEDLDGMSNDDIETLALRLGGLEEAVAKTDPARVNAGKSAGIIPSGKEADAVRRLIDPPDLRARSRGGTDKLIRLRGAPIAGYVVQPDASALEADRFSDGAYRRIEPPERDEHGDEVATWISA